MERKEREQKGGGEECRPILLLSFKTSKQLFDMVLFGRYTSNLETEWLFFTLNLLSMYDYLWFILTK